ncbi:MAG: BON domain-containing protein [Thermoguttaceae bacterium]|nr:BON domain-containing protein [Thermoguttaceae bacterium]
MRKYGAVSWRAIFLAALACATLIASDFARAQTTGETDVAQSMGVGLKSRFASGATPIQLSRTEIRPGTPMSVNSTMSNMMSNGGNSFGGILARYDTSTFGKFFGTGALTPRASASRVNALDALAQSDNEVDNLETVERMYPPRIVIDFDAFPVRALSSPESRDSMRTQIENAISRFEFDVQKEEINVSHVGSTVYLKGKVRSARLARLVGNVVSMQAGVGEVVNEIEVLQPETQNVDLYGRPL